MQISSNYNRYDSTSVSNNPNVQQSAASQATNSIKKFLEAFSVKISLRARQSAEFNDPSIKYPTHDSDVLQYNGNLSLTYKS